MDNKHHMDSQRLWKNVPFIECLKSKLITNLVFDSWTNYFLLNDFLTLYFPGSLVPLVPESYFLFYKHKREEKWNLISWHKLAIWEGEIFSTHRVNCRKISLYLLLQLNDIFGHCDGQQSPNRNYRYYFSKIGLTKFLTCRTPLQGVCHILLFDLICFSRPEKCVPDCR